MTYVVTDACIRCKYTDCVEVCPTGAFREGASMLVIDPDECIDCNACVPECPAEAILPDIDPESGPWLEFNATYAAEWPEITRKRAPLADADDFKGVNGKYDQYFSPEPGEGD